MLRAEELLLLLFKSEFVTFAAGFNGIFKSASCKRIVKVSVTSGNSFDN